MSTLYHQQQNIAGNGYIKRLEAVDRRKGGELYESVWIPVKTNAGTFRYTAVQKFGVSRYFECF